MPPKKDGKWPVIKIDSDIVVIIVWLFLNVVNFH